MVIVKFIIYKFDIYQISDDINTLLRIPTCISWQASNLLNWVKMLEYLKSDRYISKVSQYGVATEMSGIIKMIAV